MIGNRMDLVALAMVALLLLLPEGPVLGQSGECSQCIECAEEGTVRTQQFGTGDREVAYVVTVGCEPASNGCAGLLPCAGDTEEEEEQLELVMDLLRDGNAVAVAEALSNSTLPIEFVPDRRVLLFRSGCSQEVVWVHQVELEVAAVLSSVIAQ